MGLNGTLRSIGTAFRKIERERQRDLEKQYKYNCKMQELDRAAYEVSVYEYNIDKIISIHKNCGYVYNWKEIVTQEPPKEPKKENSQEYAAQQIFDKYKPNFFEKLFKIDINKKNSLEIKIELAKKEDDKIYENNLKQFQQELNDHQYQKEFAKNIMNGNLEYYVKAIEEIDPLSKISEIGSNAYFTFQSATRMKAIIHIHDESKIPRQSKSLSKSGKLTIKDTPKGRLNEIYQSYTCSSSLRVGRELFALLPVRDIVVTTKGNMINLSTGKVEEVPLLSMILTREKMNSISFETVDPVECIKNFKHNMEFKKTLGMSPVSEIE